MSERRTGHRHPDDTTSGLRDGPPGPRGRWFRRFGYAALTGVCVLAAFDLLGPRTDIVTAQGGGFTLSVKYPQVARSGQPAPLHLQITQDGGLGKTITLRLCDEFFNDLDFQNWYPNPAAETSVPPWIVYEFDTPTTGGDTLELSLDARVAPGQFGETDDCEIAILDDDKPVTKMSFTVWRMP